eukprot:3295094-Alexandrium_andersonii.AAC.1
MSGGRVRVVLQCCWCGLVCRRLPAFPPRRRWSPVWAPKRARALRATLAGVRAPARPAARRP